MGARVKGRVRVGLVGDTTKQRDSKPTTPKGAANGSGGALIIVDDGKFMTNATESMNDILDMSAEGVECFWKPIARDYVAEAGFDDAMNNGVQTRC